MSFTKTIVVSPSGNFYGSEQVLFDFLTETKNSYIVYAPAKSRFIEKLLRQKRHRIRPFSGIKKMYLEVFFFLLWRKANAVYCNEGGHIRYFKVLARIFRGAKFFVHIRILEDTSFTRIGGLTNNIVLLSVSEYLTGMMPAYKASVQTIRDPYIPANITAPIKKYNNNRIRAGIIGRVTETKGLVFIDAFSDFLERNRFSNIELHLFGDVETQWKMVSEFVNKVKKYLYVTMQFHGFNDDKNSVYNGIDLVLHFSKIEPLGRIFFESLDYGTPFIGFNAGGIGEIAKLLNLEDCMINDCDDWEQELYHRIINAEKSLQKYQAAREECMKFFSASGYCKAVEELILV